MEPLAVALWRNVDIKGLTIGQETHKLALYADNLLMYVSSPSTSLLNILKLDQLELDQFGALSNFKVNTHKSEMLNIALPQLLISSLHALFPFQWQPHHVKYVSIPADPAQVFACNFPSLLKSLKEDLSKWTNFSLSWLGRMAAVKIDILPSVLYFFQTLPILLPRCFYGDEALTIKFIWNQSRPHLKTAILTRKKEEGGVGLPDFHLYHIAPLFNCVIDLFHSRYSKLWVSLVYQISPYPTTSILWMSPDHREKTDQRLFLMSSLLTFSDWYF